MDPFIVPAVLTTAAVNAAIASLAVNGGTVWLPPGVLDISAGTIIGANNVTIRGSRGATIIRVPWHTVFNAYAVNALGCDNFHLADLTFDMGDIDPPDDDWPTSASGAVLLGSNGTTGGTDCSIESCKVINMGRYGFVARGGTRDLRIAESKLIRTAPAGAGTIGIMLRKDGGVANYFAEIIGNKTSNVCGFGGALYKGKIIRNTMRGSGFGANMELDADPNCTKNIVAENICTDGVALPPDFGVNGIECWSTDTLLANNITDDNIGNGLAVAARDCTVIGHRSSGNTARGIYIDGVGGGSCHNAFLTGCKTRSNGTPYAIDPGIVGTVFGNNDFR